jgi:hypothetical protein
MHFEQPYSEQNGKFECIFSLSLRNQNACYKLKKDFKNVKYQASHVLTKTFKTTPLPGHCNLVTLSLQAAETGFLRFKERVPFNFENINYHWFILRLIPLVPL